VQAELKNNKKEFDYSCQVTGITTTTTVIIDLYDHRGGKAG
jgi:hypothetical protein